MGTVSDDEDYGDLFISRNVKMKIECISNPAFIRISSGLCVRYKAQTDNNSGWIHSLFWAGLMGGVVILSAINEVEALGIVQKWNYDWNCQGQGFSGALRMLNPPKSLHFNCSLLSSCENTAVSWKNECFQSWRARTMPSNPHLQILLYPCCEGKFRFLWNKSSCWPWSPKDSCVTSWGFGRSVTRGWLHLSLCPWRCRCLTLAQLPDAELTCSLPRERQGCLGKRKKKPQTVRIWRVLSVNASV